MLRANFDLALRDPLASLGSFPSSFSFGLFADGGYVQEFRSDAGVKIGANILSWLPHQLRGVAEEYDPIVPIVVYFPLFEDKPLDGKAHLAWRWEIALG